MAVQYDSDKNSWGGFIADIYNAINGIYNFNEETTKFINQTKDWNFSFIKEQLNGNEEALNKWINKLELSDEDFKKFLKDWDGVGDISSSYQQWMKANGKSTSDFTAFTKKAGSALKSLGAALGSMAVNWLIGKVIDLVATGIDHVIHSTEYAEKAFKAATDSAKSFSDAIKDIQKETVDMESSVNSIAKRYAELSQGVNPLTNENRSLPISEYDEFLDLNEQLADLFPSLTRDYDENGNAILGLSGSVDSVTDSIKALVEQEKELARASIRENLDQYFNGTDEADGAWRAIEGRKKELEDVSEELEVLTSIYDNLINSNEEMTVGRFETSLAHKMESEYIDYIRNTFGEDIANAIKDVTSINQVKGAFNNLKSDFVIDFSKLELNDSQKAQIIKSYDTFYNELLAEQKTALSEFDSQNSEFSNNAILWLEDLSFYKDSNKYIKAAIQNLVHGIDWSSYSKEELNYDGVKRILQDSILTPFQVACDDPDSKEVLNKALEGLFTLNTDDLSVNDIASQVDSYFETIADILGLDDQLELEIKFGFEEITDTSKRLQNSIRQIADDHGIVDRDEYATLSDYTKDFTQAEVELWLEAALGAKNATQAVKLYESALADAKDSATSTPLSITETVNQINTQLKSAFDSLQSAYQDIFTLDEDTGEKLFSLDDVDISTFESIRSELERLDELDGINVDYSQFEDFVSVLSNTSSTAEDIQEQFNKLATDIIYTSDCTNMSAETFDLLAKSLSEMGVTNAYEMLGKIRDAQEELAELSYDAETATIEETRSLIELGLASVETEEYLRHYLIQKELAQNPLSTLEDILQLESLCNALGITGEVYETVIGLKRAFEAKESGAHASGLEDSIEAYQERLKELAAGYGSFDFSFEGTKSSSSGSSSAAKNTVETFDWIEQAIENVEKEIEELDEIANSSYSTFSEKNEALAQEISKVSEEIDLQQQAYDEYMRKAESIALPDYYKQLVQSGAINIEDISDENLQDLISEYQNWYDKAQDVSDTIKQLKTDMKDLYVSAYELQTSNLKDRLDSDSITEKQYLDSLKEAYEKFYADLEDFAEQYHEAVLDYLAEEKDYLNNVAGAAASLIDTEIDNIQDDAKLQEDSIQRQIDLLEQKKKPLQDELDALEDKAKKENLILNLQKAQYELARAENQRTKLVYTSEKGMVYTADPTSIRDAQKGVDDAKLEIQKQSIQDQIDALDDEIDRYNDLIDQINNAADVQIDALEKIKNKWQEVINQQEYAKNILPFTGEFGTDAITKLLTGNDDDLLEQWKNNYITTLAGLDVESQGYIGDITEQMASLYGVDLSPLQEQFGNVNDSINGMTASLGRASSAIGSGINVPTYNNTDAESNTSPTNLTDSITGVGLAAEQSLPCVSSNMDNIADTATNAALEVSTVANAIDNIPEYKDVTISVHTVGGNVSSGISSKVSQIAYTGNAYADGTEGLAHNEKNALRSEYGQSELTVYPDGKTELTTQPVMSDLPKGTIIYNEEQTKDILKNKASVIGNAYADGTDKDGWITTSEGKTLRPLQPGDKMYDLIQKFDTYMNSMNSNIKAIAQNAAYEQNMKMNEVVKQITNSVVNNNNQPSVMVGDVHITCPGVTSQEVAKQVGTELNNIFNGLSLKAYQRANITR